MLDGYRPKAGDEQKFVDKHVVKVSKLSKPAEDDAVFNAKNVKTYDRSPTHGYNPGKDEEVYEEAEVAAESEVWDQDAGNPGDLKKMMPNHLSKYRKDPLGKRLTASLKKKEASSAFNNMMGGSASGLMSGLKIREETVSEEGLGDMFDKLPEPKAKSKRWAQPSKFAQKLSASHASASRGTTTKKGNVTTHTAGLNYSGERQYEPHVDKNSTIIATTQLIKPPNHPSIDKLKGPKWALKPLKKKANEEVNHVEEERRSASSPGTSSHPKDPRQANTDRRGTGKPISGKPMEWPHRRASDRRYDDHRMEQVQKKTLGQILESMKNKEPVGVKIHYSHPTKQDTHATHFTPEDARRGEKEMSKSGYTVKKRTLVYGKD